jgi:hypothetical protein
MKQAECVYYNAAIDKINSTSYSGNIPKLLRININKYSPKPILFLFSHKKTPQFWANKIMRCISMS